MSLFHWKHFICCHRWCVVTIAWLGCCQHKMLDANWEVWDRWVGSATYLQSQSRYYGGWMSWSFSKITAHSNSWWCFSPSNMCQPVMLFTSREVFSQINWRKLWWCHSLRNTVLENQQKKQNEDLFTLCVHFTCIKINTYNCKAHTKQLQLFNYMHESTHT